MTTFEVEATGFFRVSVDETKFTPAFLAEYRESFSPFETVEDHIDHLAHLFARGVVDGDTKFIEGYGPPADFGIKFDAFHGRSAWIDADVQIMNMEPV